MAEKTTAEKNRIVRRPLNVACSIDIDEPAVFYCSQCKKPFCEDCIGRETAAKTLCLHCAAVEDSMEEAQQQGLGLALKKKKGFFLKMLGVMASVAIAFNLYTLYSDRDESDPSKAFKAAISPQLTGITICRSRLDALAAEAFSYTKLMERSPSSVDELGVILNAQVETKDPVTFKPYIIKGDTEGNTIVHCPTPEAHGVGSISAVAGKPARVIYANESVRP